MRVHKTLFFFIWVIKRRQTLTCMEIGGYINVSKKAVMSAITREKSGSGILFRRGAGKMKDTFCLYY